MSASDLLSLALSRVDPALQEALERCRESLATDGPPLAHLVPETLVEAMRYAVLSPGKRLRPALVLGAAKAVGGEPDDALPAACAVEMVHAYSLVHDDLPALDDDDERRGQPSCHVKFGEATALLAGDALLTEAFALLGDPRPFRKGRPVPAGRRIQGVAELARAIGAAGMIGGQVDDLAVGASPEDRRTLEAIHRRKTGRLIQASVALGAIFGGGSATQVRALRTFGTDLGLAFQLVDDVLDGDGAVALDGETAVREEAREVTERAMGALQPFGRRAQALRKVARDMAERVA
ncbi:MAG: polyprenyl synthetase family protein [Myxococcota bacterium]